MRGRMCPSLCDCIHGLDAALACTDHVAYAHAHDRGVAGKALGVLLH